MITGSRIPALLSLVVLVAGCDLSQSHENAYATYADAVNVGAVAPGKWLPVWLPASAVRIREFHRVDRPELWIEYFVVGRAEIPEEAGCTLATILSVKLPTRQHRPPEWWPPELTEDGRELIPRSGWSDYSCRNGSIALRTVNGESRIVARHIEPR